MNNVTWEIVAYDPWFDLGRKIKIFSPGLIPKFSSERCWLRWRPLPLRQLQEVQQTEGEKSQTEDFPLHRRLELGLGAVVLDGRRARQAEDIYRERDGVREDLWLGRDRL